MKRMSIMTLLIASAGIAMSANAADWMYTRASVGYAAGENKLNSAAKLEKNYGTIADMTRMPAAVFVVDVLKETIAVREANKLNIPTFAMVDTNSDPREVDYVIPANDDASKSIENILTHVTDAVIEGLSDRKAEKEAKKAEKEAAAAAPAAPKAEAPAATEEAPAKEETK